LILESKIRLAKRIAEGGITSRRDAERLIKSGRVIVDGKIANTPVFLVTNRSKILIDGKKIPQKSQEIVIWKFYKPKGVITTRYDPKNRRTVFDFFPHLEQRLIHIGRLDYNSEGLLLFTNNGDIARKMELPSTGLERTYRVRILGKLTSEKIQKLKEGVVIDGIKYRSVDIKVDDAKLSRSNSWITVILREGKNREVRKIMAHVGCIVSRLIRVGYGPFCLGNLSSGKILRASKSEIAKLLKIIGQLDQGKF
jgi:23S rRNA pseudouridine2605 synthase